MPTLNRHNHKKSVTADDIQAIAGPLKEDVVEAILRIGATEAEIKKAFDYLEESYYTMSIFARPMDQRVRRVYDILDYAGNDFSKPRLWH